jgi:RNA polymerase sigma-70 factor (ECF subfamily)
LTNRGADDEDAKGKPMDPGTRLMERVRARDVAAFEALYDGHHRLVFGIGLRMLGEPNAAEDLTQAVFMKVWTAPDTFHGGSFVAWLSRVTRNRALDMLRARAARPEVELPCTDIPLDTSVDDEALARLDARRVRDALAGLPAEQRTLIEMGFFDGVTHQELAARTGTPLGTVKTRIRSGLHSLRTALSPRVSP